MHASSEALVELETTFWQSMVDNDTEVALALLEEPALMVSTHGAMKFDHQDYRRMAEHGTMVVKAFKLSDTEVVFPTDDTAILIYRVDQTVAPRGGGDAVTQQMLDSSVWTRSDGRWRCAMHTETPCEQRSP